MRTYTHLSILLVLLAAIASTIATGCTAEIDDDGLDESDWEAEEPPDEPSTEAVPEPMAEAPIGPLAVDRFGVHMIYPSVGREWFMPANADQSSAEWSPGGGGRGKMVKTGEAGVFRVRGGPRLPVKSPAGKAWFRNVEVTAYYRYTSSLPPSEQASPMNTFGYQILVRGEMHRTGTIDGRSVNNGVAPPAGTVAGPGYPFRSGSINAHCLASSLHGYVDINGAIRFKKEISHTAGYTGERGRTTFPGGRVPARRWFGYKLVVRNRGNAVHMEAWLDAQANGTWRKVSETVDAGGWRGGSLDGCNTAPFRYAPDQVITWAGPAVLFRFDNIDTDVKWLSVREIAPL